MTTPVVEVTGLSKRFRIGAPLARGQSKGKAALNWALSPFRYLRRATSQARPEEVLWALKDVSFEVYAGEVLGIVGRNGAGKTTLLKLLSRITDPTEGQAIVRGRVGALLEVGTGFHPELTGRENIFLNGAILGMGRSEILAKFDEIVEFAEMAKFVDTAVKYYSSGMRVRLAFSVAAHLEPEVLIVDEVLAVGDVGFQKKCLGKMNNVAGEGRTVLLVSHNMEVVLGMCGRALWLEQGRMVGEGTPSEVVGQYVETTLKAAGENQIAQARLPKEAGFRFTGFALRDPQGQPATFATCGEPLDMVMSYESGGEDLRNVTVWIWVRNTMGQRILNFWSKCTGQDFDHLSATGQLVCRLPKLPLRPGSYLIDLAARVGTNPTSRVTEAARIDVVPGDFFGSGRPLGDTSEVICDYSWQIEE